jgi:hypothetical protein
LETLAVEYIAITDRSNVSELVDRLKTLRRSRTGTNDMLKVGWQVFILLMPWAREM